MGNGNAEAERVIQVLRSYFEALENGTAHLILPAPTHKWKFWKGGLTLERMRRGLQSIDDYLNHPSQHGWAERNYIGGPTKFDRGPDLSRLPDNALFAMFQELDDVLGEQADAAASLKFP